jgi:HK97 family phage prohead protease
MKQLTTEKMTLGQLAFASDVVLAASEALLKSPATPWRDLEEIPFWRKYFVMDKATSKGLAEGQIRHYITTNALDRDHEIMMPKGADLKNYKKNPVVLWGHDYSEPDNIVGKNLEINKDDKGLIALTQFNLQESKAAQVYRLYKGGWIKAWSVGFIPLKGHKPEQKEIEKISIAGLFGDPPKPGEVFYIHDKWSLLEYSTVAVPSNPEALTLSVAKDLNLSEKMLQELEIVLKELPEDKNDKNTVILDLGDGEQKKEGKEKKADAGKAKDKEPEPEPTSDTEPDPEPKQADVGDLSPFDSKTNIDAINTLTNEIMSLKTAVEEKAGRELSTKNRALIKDCVDAMAKATEALGTLLTATEPDEGKQDDGDVEIKNTLDLSALLHGEEINLEELSKEICKTVDIPKLITDSIKDNK